MRNLTRAIAAAILLGAITFAVANGADAQNVDLTEVVDSIEATGRYIERDVDANAETAIDGANADGIAFVRLDTSGDPAEFANAIAGELEARSSQYGAVLALTNSDLWGTGVAEAGPAAAEVTSLFGSGQIADGINQFTTLLNGAAIGANTGSPTDSDTSSAGAGSGALILALVILAIGAFFLFNLMRGRKKTRAAESKGIEDDRSEIIEQLKANADRVIDLGDEVITAKDPELISIYEEASAAYQNVSNEIRGAKTAAEVDALDDQIDKAEWQFEVIEARLTGQTPPPFLDDDNPPAPNVPTSKQPPPPNASSPGSSPTLSPAERDAQMRRQSGDPRPLPQRNPRVQTRRRGGGMGGMLGKMALSVVMSMLMGGRLGRPTTSRRTDRRTGGGFGGVRGPF